MPGKYIVLEGNGGVGKDTQAEILRNRFEKRGLKSIIIKEPTEIYWLFDKHWEDKFGTRLKDDSSMFRRFFIIADRAKLMREKVIPALQEGIYVISVRSFISLLVYQCESDVDRIMMTYLHQFAPTPDLVLLYDADERICFKRIKRRGEKGLFDKLEDLKKYRPRFLNIANADYLDFPVKIVDASININGVAELTWDSIKEHFLANSTESQLRTMV